MLQPQPIPDMNTLIYKNYFITKRMHLTHNTKLTNIVILLHCPTLCNITKALHSSKFPKLCLLSHLISTVLRKRWLWSTGATTMTRGNQVQGERLVTVPLSTINLTWPGLGSNLGLLGDRLVTNCLRLSTVSTVTMAVTCSQRVLKQVEVTWFYTSANCQQIDNPKTSPEHMFAFGVVLSPLTACLEYYDGWCGSLTGQEVIMVMEETQKLTTQNWNTRKRL
jgi:hypothetical protein